MNHFPFLIVGHSNRDSGTHTLAREGTRTHHQHAANRRPDSGGANEHTLVRSMCAASVERSTLGSWQRRLPDLLFGVVNGHFERACDRCWRGFRRIDRYDY